MPEQGGATTALMRQYLDVKARYPDAIVFFRLGDFYEMFHEDAVYAARVLDLTLTTRDKGKEDPVPMCGIPHHAVRPYLVKLTELGHRVALCEQLEDPRAVRGIVKRGVVRVVTPGVMLDEESLDPRAPSYVAAVVGDARGRLWPRVPRRVDGRLSRDRGGDRRRAGRGDRPGRAARAGVRAATTTARRWPSWCGPRTRPCRARRCAR